MNQRFFVALGLLLVVLLSMPVTAKDFRTRITGQPNPQDLTTLAWQEVVRFHLDAGQRPPRYRMNAYYVDTNLFILSILIPRGNEAYMATHGFYRRNGQWYISVNPDESVAPKNVRLKSSDYLSKQLDFWNTPTAFPPISNATETRQLYRLLQTAATTERWRIQPRPSLKFVNPPTPAREETRTADAFADLMAGYQDTANVLLGETYVAEDQRVLWIAVDGTCSLFLVRGTGAAAIITDWYSHIPPSDCQNAQSRICTVPLSYVSSSQTRTGGAGSSFTMDQLDDGALKQLLTRFFRFGGLNNRDEVFSYLAATIAQPNRLQWWKTFQSAAASLRLADIAVRQLTDRRIEVSFPATAGRQTLLCSLVGPQRLQVLSLNASAGTQRRSASQPQQHRIPRAIALSTADVQTEARVRLFVEKVIATAKHRDVLDYFPKLADHDYSSYSRQLVTWSRNESGSYYGSAFKKFDEQTCGIVLIEQRPNKRYRRVMVAVDYKNLEIFYFQTFDSRFDLTKAEADAALRDPYFP